MSTSRTSVAMETSGGPVRAALLRNTGGPLTIEGITLRATGPLDVRVAIERTGVCHSDLSLARGYLSQALPVVLGHEACGRVIEVGDEVDGVRLGQRVLLLWNAACRTCVACLREEPWLCDQSAQLATRPYALDRRGQPIYAGLSIGSFAEQTVVPASSTFPVDDDIDPSIIALLGCAVTTGVGAVLATAKVKPGSSVCVLGLGGVGMSAVIGAHLAGSDLIVAVDRSESKADGALRVGAHHFLLAEDTLRSKAKELAGSQGFDYVFDCVGSATTIRQAWQLTRRGGTTCVVGIGRKDDLVSFSALEIFFFARTLVGSVAGSFDSTRDLSMYLDMLRSGRLDLAPLVTSTGDLSDIDKALSAMERGEGVRAVLTPRHGA